MRKICIFEDLHEVSNLATIKIQFIGVLFCPAVLLGKSFLLKPWKLFLCHADFVTWVQVSDCNKLTRLFSHAKTSQSTGRDHARRSLRFTFLWLLSIFSDSQNAQRSWEEAFYSTFFEKLFVLSLEITACHMKLLSITVQPSIFSSVRNIPLLTKAQNFQD